jgi:hypothetical protein
MSRPINPKMNPELLKATEDAIIAVEKLNEITIRQESASKKYDDPNNYICFSFTIFYQEDGNDDSTMTRRNITTAGVAERLMVMDAVLPNAIKLAHGLDAMEAAVMNDHSPLAGFDSLMKSILKKKP